jgi:hypothetical protein
VPRLMQKLRRTLDRWLLPLFLEIAKFHKSGESHTQKGRWGGSVLLACRILIE